MIRSVDFLAGSLAFCSVSSCFTRPSSSAWLGSLDSSWVAAAFQDSAGVLACIGLLVIETSSKFRSRPGVRAASLPLLFEHTIEVVGHVVPSSMRPTQDGLVAAGKVDRDADHGEQAWRMIKSGTAGFSIGFMSKSRARAEGGRELTEIVVARRVPSTAELEPLRRLSEYLASRYGRQPAQATVYVLTGAVPVCGVRLTTRRVRAASTPW